MSENLSEHEAAELAKVGPTELSVSVAGGKGKVKSRSPHHRLLMSCQNCQKSFEVLNLFGLAAVIASNNLCPICQELALHTQDERARILELLVLSKNVEPLTDN